MPNYDYVCPECGHVTVAFRSYEERDQPQVCEMCDGVASRAWVTAPQTRTAKTSRTFLDGTRNDGYKEEVKAAELDAEAMNHNPKSAKYQELKAEAKARRLLNNNVQGRGKRYRLSESKKEKKEK